MIGFRPFGLPDKDDTPANNKKMERCVKGVMSENSKLKKSSAVAICKTSLGFTKKSEDEEGMYVMIRIGNHASSRNCCP